MRFLCLFFASCNPQSLIRHLSLEGSVSRHHRLAKTILYSTYLVVRDFFWVPVPVPAAQLSPSSTVHGFRT